MKPQLKKTTQASCILAGLILGFAAAPASAQICAVTDPVFLAEGPVSAATADGAGGGTITAMGITFQVTPTTPVASATAALSMAQFAGNGADPFPGRVQPGFLGATVIATGCVKTGPAGPFAVADDVFSDVKENVMLGVVTAPLVVDALGGRTFGADGTQVKMLTDARMPAGPITNPFGFPIVETSVVAGANVSVEGYFSNDGSNVLHAWAVETDGALTQPATPQISIQRFRCANDIEIRGGIYPTPGSACNFTAPLSLALFDGAGAPIPFDSRTDLDVVNGVAPTADFCSYRLRPAVAQCPAVVTVKLLNGTAVVAEATAP
jgi:hypothetical protein